nr:MAG TPA: hypothetical protein [Caudoviricetes sp.]
MVGGSFPPMSGHAVTSLLQAPNYSPVTRIPISPKSEGVSPQKLPKTFGVLLVINAFICFHALKKSYTEQSLLQ